MKSTQVLALIGFGLAALATPTLSTAADTVASKSSVKAPETTTVLANGLVKNIDKDAGNLTIKHGPITNLQMPPMTMVYHVASPALLDKLKVGDKIKFHAEDRNGVFTVTQIYQD